MSDSEPNWMDHMTTRLGPAGWEIVPRALEAAKTREPEPSFAEVDEQSLTEVLEAVQQIEAQAHPRYPIQMQPPPPNLLTTFAIRPSLLGSNVIQVGTIPTLLWKRDLPGQEPDNRAVLLRNHGEVDVYLGGVSELSDNPYHGLLLRGDRHRGPYEVYLAQPPTEIFGITRAGTAPVAVVPF